VAETRGERALIFMAGALMGAAGTVIWQSLGQRRFSPRLIRDSRVDPRIPATVIVPGILGSQLRRPDGTGAWLLAGNALGYHDLRLPARLPLAESKDDLEPAGLIGVDAVLPRLFGFTEYADILELLEEAGFYRDARPGGEPGAVHHVFTYDWRRDLVESARRLGETLDRLAERRGDPDARFNLIGHSMGGLLARHYLRYGGKEPGGPVTWAGARRVENLILVATPNGGSLAALDAILNGNRVGLSTTTLAAEVIARMPSIYQLLPPRGTRPLADAAGEPLLLDLQDAATWERFGWGPWKRGANGDAAREREFVGALLARATAFHDGLARAAPRGCPVRVVALGGDCLPTSARAIVSEDAPPRFEARTRREAEALFEAGDGRVTRASVLASHLPGAAKSVFGAGLAEVSHAFFGEADHHGIYREPTFQSVLLRLLLQPVPMGAESPML
jgi:pimeloyl-ACP methyl ester carboxylesterase